MATAQQHFFGVKSRGGVFATTGESSAKIGQAKLPVELRSDNDVFVEWNWNGKELVARNCRLGFFPAYYYATKTEFAISTSIEKLLEHGASKHLDDGALALCIRLGWLVGEDTIFSAIRILPPGCELVWSNGLNVLRGRIEFPNAQILPREQAIQRYGELFRDAVARRSSANISIDLPLSGGRDSRHILLELNAIGCKPRSCFTTHDFPPYREENIDVASKICQRMGIEHVVFDQRKSRLRAEIIKNRLNGFCALENIWCIDFYSQVARSASLIYEGTPGDVLSAGSYLKRDQIIMFEHGELEQLANSLIDQWLNWHGSEASLARLLSPDAARLLSRDKAVARLVSELAKHADAPNPLTSFYFWNRSRRVTAMQPFSVAYSMHLNSITPYLDHALIDFLNSLSAEMYLDKTFHSKTIELMHPEFGDIPYAGSMGTAAKEDNAHYRRFLLETATFVASKGTGVLQNLGLNTRRLVSIALSRGNVRKRMSWIAPSTTIFLAQLESITR